MIKSLRPAFFRSSLAMIIVGLIILSACSSSGVLAAEAETSPASSLATSASAQSQTTLLDPAGNGSPAVDGKAYVLYDVQSDTFLIGHNQDQPLPPASITKVMTVLLAFEELDLADTITVTRDMYENIPYGYVRLGLVEGEEITVEEAIYACLLISANDAAMALAFKMSGSVEAFADKMNAKALEIGCKNTHFTNPYGFSDVDNVTSAHDMALILKEALKCKMYSTISTTRHYLMPATNKHSETRGLSNGNRFISTTEYAYANYIGGKTGFTNLAGHTIVAGASQDGRTLIGVILGASSSTIRYSNLIALFNYGFTAFSTERANPEEFAEIKNQVLAQVKAAIELTDDGLSISDVSLRFDEYITTANASGAKSYQCTADMSQIVVQDSLDDQFLKFPLYRQYAEGDKKQVGMLEITVSQLNATAITSITDRATDRPIAESSLQKTDDPITSVGSSILRIVIIVILAAILMLCLLVALIMLKKDMKVRRRRKRARII